METHSRYSGLSILNHWVTAILVFIMLTLGLMADEAPDKTSDSYIMDVHVALGFFVFLAVAWRVGYRLWQGFPPNPGAGAVERYLGGLTHRLLLIALVVMVISGPLYLFTEGEGVDVFGWFVLHIPLTALEAIHEPAERVHAATGATILPILIGLHMLGAVHHYLRR
jgi:cytochrome b561